MSIYPQQFRKGVITNISDNKTYKGHVIVLNTGYKLEDDSIIHIFPTFEVLKEFMDSINAEVTNFEMMKAV